MHKTISLALLLTCGAAPSATVADDDVLLKAINFALTGSDRTTYTFEDRSACVVRWIHPSTKDDVKAVDTFFLNNIDLTRAAWQEMEAKSPIFGVSRSIRVVLHGESVIRENGFIPQTSQDLTANDVTLDLQTTEKDRLVRAWRYIYAHGCKSAHSSY
jgi:hypothetical protein